MATGPWPTRKITDVELFRGSLRVLDTSLNENYQLGLYLMMILNTTTIKNKMVWLHVEVINDTKVVVVDVLRLDTRDVFRRVNIGIHRGIYNWVVEQLF